MSPGVSTWRIRFRLKEGANKTKIRPSLKWRTRNIVPQQCTGPSRCFCAVSFFIHRCLQARPTQFYDPWWPCRPYKTVIRGRNSGIHPTASQSRLDPKNTGVVYPQKNTMEPTIHPQIMHCVLHGWNITGTIKITNSRQFTMR